MVAIDSTSYPYLAVAQHHNVPYSRVLDLADYLDRHKAVGNIYYPQVWMMATLQAWMNERARRKAVEGL